MAHSVLNIFSLILTFVVQTVAVNLVGCGPDKPLVVQENTQNYTIVCDDIRSDNDVRWVLTRTVSNRTGSNVGYCQGDSSVCAGGNPLISFSRPSRNVSIVQIAKVTRSNFGMANITCSGISQTGELVMISSSCNIDIIYISENISCKIEFKDTWTVFGQCDIYKTSSSENRYRCTWIEINESLNKSVVVAYTSMTVVPFNGTYVNGSCNFTSYLPPNGLYTYHVTVVPGEVTVNANFIGSNEIRRPSSTPYHNCPQYVSQGEGVTCECFINDLGSPPGVLLWNTTRSSQLRVTDVQVINNMSHVCHLIWNNTFVRSVEYVVNIGDSARVLTFNMNNIGSKTVIVDENAHVEMRCNSDGRPTPSIRLVNVSNTLNLLNQSHTQEVSYNIEQAPCEASGVYRCDANNSIGQDSKSCILLVSCAPKRTNVNGNPPTVNVTNGVGVLTVNLTAYPTPQMKTLTYLGTNVSSDGHQVKENSVYVACSTTLLAPALVTCNVIVVNMIHDDEGFYRIVFSNSLGDLPFTLIVKVSENDQETGTIPKTDEKIAGVVVLAVMLSVFVVVIVVAVIWVWRRGWTLPCADVNNQRSMQQNQSSGNTSEHCLAPGTTNTLITTQGATPLYDALQMKDVGKQSHYEGILQEHNGMKRSSDKDLSSNTRKTRNEPIYVN